MKETNLQKIIQYYDRGYKVIEKKIQNINSTKYKSIHYIGNYTENRFKILDKDSEKKIIYISIIHTTENSYINLINRNNRSRN